MEIPKAKKFEFKSRFIERYKDLTDIKKFIEHSTSYIRRSVRINTNKISIEKAKNMLSDWTLTQVPWAKNAFFVKHKKEDRYDIGNTDCHKLGYIYIQEASSMLPAIILNPKHNEKVLDLTAAPGSKTTQMCEMMENSGSIVANEFDRKRINILDENCQRMGCINVIITNYDAKNFPGEMKFDKILLDAPCSGTGAIMKSLKTIETWNPNMISKLSRIQKIMLNNALNLLNKKGVLVYSTCSIDPEENEFVVDKILSERKDVELIEINVTGLKTSKPIMEFNNVEFNPNVKKCLRIWPQDNNTGGFFVAKFRKEL